MLFFRTRSCSAANPGSSSGRFVTPRSPRPQAQILTLNPGRHKALVAPMRGGQKASRVSRQGEFKVTPLSRSSSAAATRPLRELCMHHNNLRRAFFLVFSQKSGPPVSIRRCYPGSSYTCVFTPRPPIPVLLMPSRSLWSGSVAYVLCP